MLKRLNWGRMLFACLFAAVAILSAQERTFAAPDKHHPPNRTIAAVGESHPWQQDWLWIAVSAGISAVVALATLYLGWQTRNLAGDTRDAVTEARLARIQDDRHHQEALMPVCQFIGTVEMVFEKGEDPPDLRTFHVYDGYIENSGSGVATLVQADIASAITEEKSIVWNLFPVGTIAANGGRREFKTAVLVYDSRNPPANQVGGYMIRIGYHNFINQRGSGLQTQGFLGGTKMTVNNATFTHPENLDRA